MQSFQDVAVHRRISQEIFSRHKHINVETSVVNHVALNSDSGTALIIRRGEKMFTIAICDDDKAIRYFIQKCIKEFAAENSISVSIDLFDSGKKLLNSSLKYNIIFLDIILQTENGIDIGTLLRKNNTPAYIIYITNYRQYHKAAHNVVHSFAFLSKPISKANIYEQLNDILFYESQNTVPLYIIRFITYEQGLTEFNVDDIYFFEYIKKRHVRICSKNGDYHINKKIGNINIDMSNYDFFMPHQSFVVNLKYVKDIKNYELLMTNGFTMPLSQKRAVLFKNALNNYLEKMLIL